METLKPKSPETYLSPQAINYILKQLIERSSGDEKEVYLMNIKVKIKDEI